MAGEAPAPLSDAEMREVRQRANNLWQARYDIMRLLATLAARDARLTALERENTALREIVAAVAAMHTNDMRRAVEGAPALITRARALLGVVKD